MAGKDWADSYWIPNAVPLVLTAFSNILVTALSRIAVDEKYAGGHQVESYHDIRRPQENKIEVIQLHPIKSWKTPGKPLKKFGKTLATVTVHASDTCTVKLWWKSRIVSVKNLKTQRWNLNFCAIVAFLVCSSRFFAFFVIIIIVVVVSLKVSQVVCM